MARKSRRAICSLSSTRALIRPTWIGPRRTCSRPKRKFELASNDLVRGERLLKARAISEEEADSRSKAVRTSAAAIQSARAAVEMAKLNMEYTRITAPISGRIGRKLITEGNLVNGNQGEATLLTTIVSLDPIYCYFDADERSIIKYQQLAREGQGRQHSRRQNGLRIGAGRRN